VIWEKLNKRGKQMENYRNGEKDKRCRVCIHCYKRWWGNRYECKRESLSYAIGINKVCDFFKLDQEELEAIK
jgi:hypothetical protein